MTTLVIGARGSVGRRVLDQLREAGEPVRASARNPNPEGLPAGVEVVAADLTQPGTLRAAMEGIQRVFLYSSPEGVDGFVTAAEQAGVEHVVLLSSATVLLPGLADNLNTQEHRQVEEAFSGSSLRLTPIRPLVLANNALNWSYPIRRDGSVPLAYPDAVMAPIHERDIAAVAVHALVESTPSPAVSAVLTGPALLSQRRQVELVGAAIGRQLKVTELSDANAQQLLSQFMPPLIAEAIVEVLANAAQGGSPATETAQQVLGRPPVSFADWASEHADAFR